MIIVRNTIQRSLILQTVQKLHTHHPTAEEVYQELHKKHPSISMGTVYRNLHQLAASGEIKNVLMPNSPERFDDTLSKHYHFRCKICNAIFDVDLPDIPDIDKTVKSKYGFEVDEHDIAFSGICSECRKNK